MATLDWSAVDEATSIINTALEEIEVGNHVAANTLVDQVNTVLDDNQPGFLDALIGAVSAAGDLAAGLLEGLADTADFWSSLWPAIAEQFPDRQLAFGNFVAGVFRMLSTLLAGELQIRVESARRTIEDALQSGGDRPIDPDALTRAIGSLPTWAQNVIGLTLAAAAGYNYILATNAGPLSATEQASLSRYLPNPLSLATLTEAVKRGDIGIDWAKNHAKRLGISSELYDIAQKLEQQRLTPNDYVTLWLRTKSEAHIDEIRKQGVAEDDIERLLYLAFAEPTPSDIVRFLVRDAYDEEASRQNLYDEDFDKKYRSDAFDRVGVSKELAQLYWRAHWQLPSPTQGYEMVHREQITMEQLRELLKLSDYAPGYVDKLINIAYNVPGRIDLRRMWEVGSITDRAELVRRYGHLGYNHQDAELLADFSIKLSERTKANEAERKRSPLAAQLVRAHLQGVLDFERTRAALIDLGFTSEEADARMAEASFGRERERADRIRDAVGRQYVRGAITEDEAAAKLEGYGFLAAEVTNNLESWNLDRELRDWTEAEQHERDLSRADIISAFEAGILGASDAQAQLVSLGYDPSESETILRLSAAKSARADAKAEQDAIRVSYVARKIDAGEARNRLDTIGTSAARRDALMARWTVDRDERTPDLPISWLERLIFHALISEGEARSEMERRGFSEQEVAWALQLWGTDVSVARERIEQQQRQFTARQEAAAEALAQRIGVQERALQLRERTATTAQVLQQARFQQTLEQRDRLAQERLDAGTAARTQSASLQATRDAANFARQKELQATGFEAQLKRLERQIDAAAKRQEDAQQQQLELQSRRDAAAVRASQAQDVRQQRTVEAQLVRLERQIAAADARLQQTSQLRLQLQAQQQDFQDRQRQAREAAQEAARIAQEAARIRQESRQESSTIRREERGSARRTIERTEAAQQTEALRSLSLQRDAAIADLNARLAALEATAAEERMSMAERQQRAAQDTLSRLIGPALVFEPAL